MRNRFVWVDIPVLDLDRAVRFYAEVLGINVTIEEAPGFKFALLEHHDNEVGGCLVPADSNNAPSGNGPMVYMNVDGRMAAAVAAVAVNGGKVLTPAHPIGPYGHRAIVQDSEGNRLALHALAA
jgi:predicted enzyme related to lactoylglutathione lyase